MGLKLTEVDLVNGQTEKGGYTRKQLEAWGVPYPPPKGWKEALLDGKTMEEAGLESVQWSPIRNTMDAHELLRTVVMAVIEAGHAYDLYEFPDVMEYFGFQNPTPEEMEAHYDRRIAEGEERAKKAALRDVL